MTSPSHHLHPIDEMDDKHPLPWQSEVKKADFHSSRSPLWRVSLFLGVLALGKLLLAKYAFPPTHISLAPDNPELVWNEVRHSLLC